MKQKAVVTGSPYFAPGHPRNPRNPRLSKPLSADPVSASDVNSRRPPKVTGSLCGVGVETPSCYARPVITGRAFSIPLALLLLVPSPGTSAAPSPEVTLESLHFRCTLAPNGHVTEFVDRARQRDWLRQQQPVPFARLRLAGRDVPSTALVQRDSLLEFHFAPTPIRVLLRVTPRPSHVVLRLEDVTGGEPDAITFLHVPLDLKGTPAEPFGACALGLNLATRIDALPALQSELRASAEKPFGLVGAKVAVVAAPMDRLRPALQEALAQDSELPVCRTAGPWAHESAFSGGSYLFNFGSLTETNVEDWIAMTRSLGFTQIDHHGGGDFFRFGDFELNRERWPDGWAHWEPIVDRLHQAGIGSIFHTYAFFIDKRSRYVTPVPDPRLDAFRTFTLTAPVTAASTVFEVAEPTADLRTVTGFFEHNSILLHIGDELVTFGGASREAPWRITGLQRGALGTRASPHAAGTPARHLKECFGLLVPNVESSLFEEIAAHHADIVNRAGFDGLYLDAIDGSSILRGGDACWYWASKFVVEIQRRLRRPTGMEMSAMWHPFWQYRTRWQAWDYPQRGHARFLDLHAQEINGGLLLPRHLGWWNFQAFNPPQVEPSYPEVMENLVAKLVGWDAGISLTGGVDRHALRTTPLFQQAVAILRAGEQLRHTNTFDDAAKARLREPGRQFALAHNAAGAPVFRTVQPQAHTVSPGEPWTLSWTVTNAFADQPIRLRIETLMTAAPLDDPSGVDLLQDSPEASPWQTRHAPGVSRPEASTPAPADPGWTLAATNRGQVPRSGAWARWDRTFNPTLNLKQQQALGLELEGDGSGAWLAIRLESPHHLAYGAVADRYLPIDFTGRRRVTLLETEAARWSDFTWNDGKSLYNVYRETIDFSAIESISVWLQHLPTHRPTRLRLLQLRALPMKSVALRRPRLTVGGVTLEFPVDLASGGRIEGASASTCASYGPKGEPLGTLQLPNLWPRLAPGPNTISFDCAPADGPAPRARITMFPQEQ